MFDRAGIAEIAAKQRAWAARLEERALAARGERQTTFETSSRIPIQRLYTPVDVADGDYLDSLGFPGEYPFTRGCYPVGYRSTVWQPRPYCGYGTGEETNQRIKYLLAQTGRGDTINIIVDSPTTYHGLDADDPLAEGEVGRTGVSLSSLRDMEDIFADIQLDKISVTFAQTGVISFAMYLALCRQRGVPLDRIWGSLLNNPFGSYVSCNHGNLPAPADALKELTDAVEYAVRYMPKWNPASVGGYECREAGCTAVQELAIMLGNGIAYTEAALARGLSIDEVAPRWVFYCSVGNNLFEEVAKLRAARRMWARIAKERFGATNPRAMGLRMHCQTSGLTLTAEQPLNNVVRATLQSLAAVLGGTNSLYTDAYDEALSLPSEEGHTLAIRTQQIILEESGAADTVDPLGGSFFVEWLTDRMEEEAGKFLAQIDALGGMTAAISSGWLQQEIDRAGLAARAAIERGERVVVGVNKYRSAAEEQDIRLFEVDPAWEEKQRRRLRELRANRDNEQVQRTLERLADAARGGESLVEPCRDAAAAYATNHELAQALAAGRASWRDGYYAMKTAILRS